jgi:hypothetical protein
MNAVVWRLRPKTLVIAMALVAVALYSDRMLKRRAGFIRDSAQVRVWTGERNMRQKLANAARSKGDREEAAKWDKLTAYAEGWRQVFEHRMSGSDFGDGPPIPKLLE